MREPKIVTDWCSLPPVTSYGGEEFSTRVLELQHRNLEKENTQLKARVEELEECNANLQSLQGMIELSDNQVKADAIREAVNYGIEKSNDISDDEHRFGAKSILLVVASYAKKVERGES